MRHCGAVYLRTGKLVNDNATIIKPPAYMAFPLDGHVVLLGDRITLILCLLVIFISRRDEERQHASGIQWGRHESAFLYRYNYNIIRTLCHPRLLHQQELITSYLRADQSGSDPLHAGQR